MSAIAASGKIAAVAQKSTLDKQDLSELQGAVEAACLTLEEAEALFRLERIALKCPGWGGFFSAVLTDYIVWQSRPTGMVNSEQAAWLLAQDDAAKTLGSLALLVNIVAEADTVPASFIEAVRARIRARSPSLELLLPARAAA
jgi:hypothetical protein